MRVEKKQIVKRALENSCQNAKQRDRPAASLSTQNQAGGLDQAPPTTVKAEPRLRRQEIFDQYDCSLRIRTHGHDSKVDGDGER